MINETTLKVMKLLQVDWIEAVKLQELMAQEPRATIRNEETFKSAARAAYRKLHGGF